MQASQLISSSILPVCPDDNGENALKLMDELKLSHLPVVRKGTFLGIISENEILEWDQPTDKIENHLHKLVAPFVLENQHLFDIIEILEKNSLSMVPVLSIKKKYLGAISHRKLLFTIAKSVTVQSIGSIFVLEINQNDYSMTEIARIIESNDAKILSSNITSAPDSTKMELTLKINKIDISAIIRDFERHNYTILASYFEDKNSDDLLQRYESLMRFLNP